VTIVRPSGEKIVTGTPDYIKQQVKKGMNALPSGKWDETDFLVYMTIYSDSQPNDDIRKSYSQSVKAGEIANKLNIVRLSHSLPKKSAYELKYYLEEGKYPSAKQVAAKQSSATASIITPDSENWWARFVAFLNVKWP
jgi:hypothetical protein